MLTRICKLHLPGQPAVYATLTEAGRVVPFYGVNRASYNTLSDLQAGALLSGETLAEHVNYLVARTSENETLALTDLSPVPDPNRPYLLPPIDKQEVWAAGVTYLRSRAARMEESTAADIYERVYEAERPELFFKTTAHRVSGPGAPVRARAESTWTVPEPELALVLDSSLRIIGYTICNDMTARDVEGANPLYLPQAKIYRGCCALGPAILLADTEDEVPPTFQIFCKIYRGGEVIFSAESGTDRLKRSLDELVHWLGRENDFPDGVILSTGTGIVPPNDFSCRPGDMIEIELSGIGLLANPVVA